MKRTTDAAASTSASSCAECRRSKIKCDKVFPCQPCVRRGCAALCPTGTLSATKGNALLAERAQRLAASVQAARAQVAALEAALAPGHPLLQPAPADADVDAVAEALGSVSLGAGGKARYYGESAGAEFLLTHIESPVRAFPPRARGAHSPQEQDADADASPPCDSASGLPPAIIALSRAFPMGASYAHDTHAHAFALVQYLPREDDARALVDAYYATNATMFDPIIRADLLAHILAPLYAPSRPGARVHPHELAILFAVLAAGAQPAPAAAQYHVLARAAFALAPLKHGAGVASVQALFLLTWALRSADPKSHEERWLLAGLCVRVAQQIGLQREVPGAGLGAAEVQTRRYVFWELYFYEAITSLINGRPPALRLEENDCPFAQEYEPFVNAAGNLEESFSGWKHRYGATTLTAVVRHVFLARPAPYAALLALDAEVRGSHVAAHLRCPVDHSDGACAWARDPAKALQQYALLTMHEC
ncbi:hypothetical protein HWV62_5284, partial [Athelia sp. TMB]